jgi:hypothetical protein
LKFGLRPQAALRNNRLLSPPRHPETEKPRILFSSLRLRVRMLRKSFKNSPTTSEAGWFRVWRAGGRARSAQLADGDVVTSCHFSATCQRAAVQTVQRADQKSPLPLSTFGLFLR